MLPITVSEAVELVESGNNATVRGKCSLCGRTDSFQSDHIYARHAVYDQCGHCGGCLQVDGVVVSGKVVAY